MIVFTCVNKENEDAAVMWAATLKHILEKGPGGILTYMFHTPDVNTTRFSDFNVHCISVGEMGDRDNKEMLLRVLDMMKARNFGERVMYTDTHVLFQGQLAELSECPLDTKIWLSARNEYVGFDDDRNKKFYPMYDEDFQRKQMIAPLGYFNSDVMLMLLPGLHVTMRSKGIESLEAYHEKNRDEKGWSAEDTLNSLISEYVNLFDRFNCFAEEVFNLDFGEMLRRREDIKRSAIVNFRGVHKPWRPTVEGDMPELAGTMYPHHHYLEAATMFRTYLTKDFFEAIRANAKRYRMIQDWERDVLDNSRPLKEKLTKFKEKLDEEIR